MQLENIDIQCMEKLQIKSHNEKFRLVIYNPETPPEEGNILLELNSDKPFQSIRRGDIISPFDHKGKPVPEYAGRFPKEKFIEIAKVVHQLIPDENGDYGTHEIEVTTQIYKPHLNGSNDPDAVAIIEINTESKTLEEAVNELSKKMILTAHVKNKGNISRTARELGLTRRQLYMKMTAYQISNFIS